MSARPAAAVYEGALAIVVVPEVAVPTFPSLIVRVLDPFQVTELALAPFPLKLSAPADPYLASDPRATEPTFNVQVPLVTVSTLAVLMVTVMSPLPFKV
jgi:hypothetical protein